MKEKRKKRKKKHIICYHIIIDEENNGVTIYLIVLYSYITYVFKQYKSMCWFVCVICSL
eukprot:UN10864